VRGPLASDALLVVRIKQNPFGRTVQILVLAAAQRPDEGDEAEPAQEKGDRDEVAERVHRL
jgi:hypothetical protein